MCSRFWGTVHKILEVSKILHAPAAIGTSVKFQLNWENLFSTEIIVLKRWFCGQSYLLWGEIRISNFDILGTLIRIFGQSPSTCGFAFLTVIVLRPVVLSVDDLLSTQAAGCQVKYNSTECGQKLSQKIRYGGSGWTGMKGIRWFAFRTGSFMRQPLSREIPTLSDKFSKA